MPEKQARHKAASSLFSFNKHAIKCLAQDRNVPITKVLHIAQCDSVKTCLSLPRSRSRESESESTLKHRLRSRSFIFSSILYPLHHSTMEPSTIITTHDHFPQRFCSSLAAIWSAGSTTFSFARFKNRKQTAHQASLKTLNTKCTPFPNLPH